MEGKATPAPSPQATEGYIMFYSTEAIESAAATLAHDHADVDIMRPAHHLASGPRYRAETLRDSGDNGWGRVALYAGLANAMQDAGFDVEADDVAAADWAGAISDAYTDAYWEAREGAREAA